MRCCFLFFGLLLSFAVFAQPSQPVFKVDFKDPTADKPQSKLWFNDGCWWALLPRSSGPSLWQRTAHGWVEHVEVNQALRGVPGRADVWADGGTATAVGVSKDSLVVFRIEAGAAGSGLGGSAAGQAGSGQASSGASGSGLWKSTVLAVLKTPEPEDIETATIARDGHGGWWVAADGTTAVYVWHSVNGQVWSKAILLKSGINKDDICVVTTIKNAVMVSWSNQNDEAVQCRVHIDGHAPEKWGPETNVEIGGKTADDHLHTALTADGTVWMVTKNSVDSNGLPQLVLRVRHPDGGWSNFPYAPRTAKAEPSRPVIIATPQGMLIEAHTIYDKTDRFSDRIVFGRIDTTVAGIVTGQQVLIVPPVEFRAHVNNCTVSKAPFPAGAPWIVLASDGEGRIFETELSAPFKP